MRMFTLPLVLGVALAACGRESPPAPTQPAKTAHDTTVEKIDRLAATADSVSADSMKSLVGRLSYEAAHRPAATPRAEDVLAALERAGVRLDDHKQYVAATARAAYCVGGQTSDGLSVAVCEYESPAAATAGRAHITARFQIPDLERVIHQRGATTLALGHHRDLKLAATVQTAAAAFSAL
jgi:hypothetical protein